MEDELAGVLIIGVALAFFSLIAGVLFLNLPWWLALVLYSVVGALSVLFIGWRKYRCAEQHDPLHSD